MSDNFTENQKPQEQIQPQPRKNKVHKKRKNKGLLIFIIILILVLTFGIIKDILFSNFEFSKTNTSNSQYVAELYIEGTIEKENEQYNQEWLLKTIDQLQNDINNVGTILFINSPGGSVYESDQVYLKLMEYAKEKTLWAYLGQTAASGGYYIACASEKIIANRNTLTGSIGVIAGQSFDLSEFMTNHGIKMNTITAGKNKNMLNINQPITEEQKNIMQSIADECYNQFVQIVATGRNLPTEKVIQIADGRVYTAKQALNNNLIDEINTYEETINQMKIFFEDINNLDFIEYKYQKDDFLYNILFNIYSQVNNNKIQFDYLEKIKAGINHIDYPAYIYVK